MALLLLLLLLLLIVAFEGVGVVSYLLRMMRGGSAAFGGLQMSLSLGFPSTRQQQHQQREKKSAIAAAAAAAAAAVEVAAAAPFQADALPGAAAAGRQGSASHGEDAASAAVAGPNASLLSREVVSLPVTYDPVPATATAEGSGCFCVPWDVDSDDWWSQHGAEWNVDSSKENATHTCYVRRSGVEEQQLRRMYQVQFGSNRSNNATNCTLRKMWSDGLASDLRNLMDGLVGALQSGVPFTPDATPWHYAALQDHSRPACMSDLAPTYLRGDVTPSCFFLPLSNCVNRRDIVKDRGIVTYANGRPPSFVKNGHLLQFILRPRQWVRRHVFLRSQGLRQQLLEALQDSDVTDAAGTAAAGRRSSNRARPAGCTVVHVRRGDVVLGNSRSTSRRKYRPLADYLLHVRTRTVLLLTDDSDAIAESQQQQFTNFTFVYWNRTRYRGSEGGWEEHLPSRDPLEEMAVLLGTFDVVPLCHALVHTASNFGQLLYALMVHGSSSHHRIPTKSGGVRRVNLDALTPQQQQQQRVKQKEQSAKQQQQQR
jgi:hypothetical protein